MVCCSLQLLEALQPIADVQVMLNFHHFLSDLAWIHNLYLKA